MRANRDRALEETYRPDLNKLTSEQRGRYRALL